MPKMAPEHCQDLGTRIFDVMSDIRSLDLPEGMEVEQGSLEFYLGDTAEELTGKWKITVEFLGLD